jgi:hypothetical protein
MATQESPATAKRVMGLLDKTIAGPIASLVVAHSFGGPAPMASSRSGRLSDAGGMQRTRFCTTKTGELLLKALEHDSMPSRMSDQQHA